MAHSMQCGGVPKRTINPPQENDPASLSSWDATRADARSDRDVGQRSEIARHQHESVGVRPTVGPLRDVVSTILKNGCNGRRSQAEPHRVPDLRVRFPRAVFKFLNFLFTARGVVPVSPSFARRPRLLKSCCGHILFSYSFSAELTDAASLHEFLSHLRDAHTRSVQRYYLEFR